MSEDPEKKIVIDSDWKEQVKREKEKQSEDPPTATSAAPAEAAAENQPEPSHAETSSASEPGMPEMPKPDFPLLVSMLATQAFAALGQIPDPVSQQTTVQPEVAKHLIELLSVLEEKTKGNLDMQEKLMLESILHDLRMTFVSVQSK